MKGTLLLVAAVVSVSAAPHAVADPNDDVFISVLDQEGIAYGGRSDGLAMGHSICITMDQYHYTTMQMTQAISHNHAMTISDSAYVVGAAISSFCPWDGGK